VIKNDLKLNSEIQRKGKLKDSNNVGFLKERRKLPLHPHLEGIRWIVHKN
jgi:hypothetical protein